MSENNCFSFNWVIHNFSYCWQKCEEALVSPLFCIYMPEKTKWKLLLYPRGMDIADDSISIYLHRDKNCEGAENIRVEYCLDILDTDGSGLDDISTFDEFEKAMQRGYPRYITRGFVPKYLQQDVLTFRCNIFRLDGKAVKRRQIYARNIIGIGKRIFQCTIENFSNWINNQIKPFVFETESKEVIMQINLNCNNKGNICFGIFSYDGCIKFSSVKIFIVNSNKQNVDCGEYEYWFEAGKCPMLTVNLIKREVIKNKRHYLPEDILVLRFEITFSTGFAFEGIEKDSWVTTSTLYPCPDEATEDWRKCIDHKSLSDCPCALITDLSSLHTNKNTCDMILQTKTNVFPVHTLILSARSPVFEAMFSNDMKEKIEGSVDVSDLDDETVRRFLLYMYSDQLENLKWDDAFQLYKAADRYAVISLRNKCSKYLKSNLKLENVCQALVLSDLHQDEDLKEITQNFILKNRTSILKSKEWKQLEAVNSKLARETKLRMK